MYQKKGELETVGLVKKAEITDKIPMSLSFLEKQNNIDLTKLADDIIRINK